MASSSESDVSSDSSSGGVHFETDNSQRTGGGEIPLENALVFHNYKIVKELGKGSYGTVFHVTDPLAQTDFALKEIRPEKDEDTVTVLREIRALSKLEHVGLVRYHHSWVDHVDEPADDRNGNSKYKSDTPDNASSENEPEPASWCLYIKMELCGESLEKWLEDHSSTGCRHRWKILDIFFQVLAAMAYMHERGYMHRDIKPANIFLSNANAKIGDFGLVKKTRVTTSDSENQTAVPENHTGSLGTDLYMSPEQVAGEEYSNKVDVFALGIILVELLVTFSTGSERIEVLQNAGCGNFPEQLKKEYPQEFALLEKLCAADPNCRPSAEEVLQGDLCKEFLGKVASNIEEFSKGAKSLLLSHGRRLLNSSDSFAWKQQMQEEVEMGADVFVETPAYKKALEIMEERDTLLLTGQPGCGMTLLARRLLSHLCKTGDCRCQPLVVSKPSELESILPISEPVALLVDDIFGRINFVPSLLPIWQRQLAPLSASGQGNKIVCTCRTNVFKQSQPLSRARLFQDMTELQMTEESNPIPPDIKRQIFDVHFEKRQGQPLSVDVVNKICSNVLPCFPQSVEMYLRSPVIYGDPEIFFQHPLAAYCQHLRAIFQDGDLVQIQVLVLAILQGGILDFDLWENSTDSLGEDLCTYLHTRFCLDVRKDWNKLHDVALTMVGTYLKWHRSESGCPVLVFLHPSIHDAAVAVLSEHHSDFLIKAQNIHSLMERVEISEQDVSESQNHCQIHLQESQWQSLAKRFVEELGKGNTTVCRHRAFGEEGFVDVFWKLLCDESKLLCDEKNDLEQSLLYWSAWSPSFRLFQRVLDKLCSDASKRISSAEFHQCALACCMNGNAAALEMLLSAIKHTDVPFSVSTPPESIGIIPLPSVPSSQLLQRQQSSGNSGTGISSQSSAAGAPLPLGSSMGDAAADAAQMPLADSGGSSSRTGAPWEGSILHVACLHEQEEVVELLLQHRADVNAKTSSKKTPLHVAARHSGLPIVQKLVQAGADPLLEDSSQQTAFHKACAMGDSRTACWLASKSPDLLNKLDSQGLNGLHLAAVAGSIDLVVYLVDRCKMTLDAPNSRGEFPIQLACEKNGNAKMIKKLAQLGSNLQVRTKKHIDTLLHVVCRSTSDVSMLDTLVELGAEVNAFNKYRQTPLHLACLKNRYGMVEALVKKHHADVSVENNRRQCPSQVTTCEKISHFLDEVAKMSESPLGSEPDKQ